MEVQVKCPYCDHENDYEACDVSWEDGAEDMATCRMCDKEFTLKCSVSYDHEAEAIPCDEGHHKWGEVTQHDITPSMVKDWKEENPEWWKGLIPHTYFKRACENCSIEDNTGDFELYSKFDPQKHYFKYHEPAIHEVTHD